MLAAAFVEAEGTVAARGGTPIAAVVEVVVVVEASASGFGAEVEVGVGVGLEREKGRKAGGEVKPTKFSSPHRGERRLRLVRGMASDPFIVVRSDRD